MAIIHKRNVKKSEHTRIHIIFDGGSIFVTRKAKIEDTLLVR